MCESILPAFCVCFRRSNNQQKRERERDEKDDDDTGLLCLCLIFEIVIVCYYVYSVLYVITLAFTLYYVLLLPSLD